MTAALLLASAGVAQAALWDAGLLQGGWRSDLPRPGYGSAEDPLVFDTVCRFPGVAFALCPATPGPAPARVFANTHWRHQPVDPLGRFWVVGANVEPAGDAACNSGPPNQSEVIGEPFEEVFGLRFGPPEDGRAAWRNEWQLAIDLAHRPRQLAERPDCVAGDFIPYLGVGLSSERGSDGEPFAMWQRSVPGPLLRFGVRLVESNAEVFAEGETPAPSSRGQHAGIWIESHWGGIRRWVWLTLFSSFESGDELYAAPWNWALRESVHAPGADIVVAALPALRAACPMVDWHLPVPAPAAWQGGVRHSVAIDVASLFDCLAERFQTPPPADETFPLTGIHVWVEVGLRERDGLPGYSVDDYDSRLAMAFDGIDVLPQDPHDLSSDRRFLIRLGGRLMALQDEQVARRLDAIPASLERSAVVARLLDDPLAEQRSLLPAALQQLILGEVKADGVLGMHRRHLASGRLSPDSVARLLIRSPEFTAAATESGDVARLLQSRFLSAAGGDREQALARFPQLVDSGKWSASIAAGEVGSEQLALRLAEALLTLPEGRLAMQVVVLYEALLGIPPDPGGIAFWVRQPDMPERLAELLYFAPEMRQRWISER